MLQPCKLFLAVVMMAPLYAAGQHATQYAPAVDGTGGVLIYQTDRNIHKSWQLVMCVRQNGKWSQPQSIDAINRHGEMPAAANHFQADFIGTPALSHGGDTLYFTATFKGGYGGKDLYYSVKRAGVWSAPVTLGPEVNSTASEESPSVSADGQTLYFTRASGRAGDATRCYQIYTARRNRSGGWARPVLMPATINSGCEKAPRILADNVTLVFSSRREGQSDFDLYVSVFDVSGKWSSPVKISELCTKESDLYAAVDHAGGDVYYNTVSEKGTALIRVLHAIPPSISLQRYFELRCSGVDAIRGHPVKANYQLLMESGSNVLIAQEQGREQFRKTVYGQKPFRLVVSAPGYESQSVKIDLATEANAAIHHQVRLIRDTTSTSAGIAQPATRELFNDTTEFKVD